MRRITQWCFIIILFLILVTGCSPADSASGSSSSGGSPNDDGIESNYEHENEEKKEVPISPPNFPE